uniref:ZP domain-containing protein n=1 Tax=Lepisosteus oculatus TaxID=7918 RepID=W5M9I2_LEPOC
MSVFVDKSSIHEVDENNLRLNDPSCKVTSNKSHFIASVSLNSCGTELEEMENSLVFKNEITSFDAPHNVITRGNVLEIPFSCSFPKTFLTSGSFTVHKTVDTFTSSGSGRFTYVFEFYNSSAFTELIKPSTYPVNAEQGEMLYVSIQVRSSLNTTQLFVESCRATPHDDPDDPIYYDIIKNGCKIDETLVVYPSNQTVYRFGMKAFNFIGEYNQVYINCVVILCLAGNPNTRCAQGCIN